MFFQISRDGGSAYEVPVEITGSEDQRESAKEMIESIISDDDGYGRRDDRGGEVVKIKIPRACVGKVIGKYSYMPKVRMENHWLMKSVNF